MHEPKFILPAAPIEPVTYQLAVQRATTRLSDPSTNGWVKEFKVTLKPVHGELTGNKHSDEVKYDRNSCRNSTNKNPMGIQWESSGNPMQ